MSFREKSAWITLVSILLVSAVYLVHGPWALPPGLRAHGLGMMLALFVLIEVVAHVVIAVRAPKDARAPRDEREELIELKATRVAAYVFVIGTFSAVGTLHLGTGGGTVGYFIVLAFVVAEVVNYGTRIFYHRRGF